jgi:receptor protein-tyrosine kinase
MDHSRPQEAPSEEFRSLRTRLNHLQTLQPIHTVVATSPSPAEGKSFAAANLAISESHPAGNPTLLVDFDFRRSVLHNLFQIERTPGATIIDMAQRAMQSLCENHVLGIIVNGARAGEPYSKYTYYYSKYGHETKPEPEAEPGSEAE